eukprot:149424_1
MCQQFETRNDLSNELRNGLVDFYGHFEDLNNAQKYFNSIIDKDKNDITINIMMNVYNQYNKYDNVLFIYNKYHSLHDDISHIEAIKACIIGNKLNEGYNIINNINENNECQSIQLKNTLIDFYGHFGDILQAQKLFDEMKRRNEEDAMSVNSLMKVYINNNKNDTALLLYDEHKKSDKINSVSYLLAIRACSNICNFEKGQEIHDTIDNNEFEDEQIIFIKTALIDFYSKLKYMNMTLNVFDSMSDAEKINVVVINSMM